MLANNVYGPPFRGFRSRLKGKPFKESAVVHELEMLTMGIVLLSIAAVHPISTGLIGLSKKRLTKMQSKTEDEMPSLVNLSVTT